MIPRQLPAAIMARRRPTVIARPLIIARPFIVVVSPLWWSRQGACGGTKSTTEQSACQWIAGCRSYGCTCTSTKQSTRDGTLTGCVSASSQSQASDKKRNSDHKSLYAKSAGDVKKRRTDMHSPAVIQKTLHIMTYPADWLVTAAIVRAHRPESVCEIGAGSGDWCIGVAALVPTPVRCLMIENFEYAKRGFMPTTYRWPTNKSELMARFAEWTSYFGVVASANVHDDDITALHTQDVFSIIRIDAYHTVDDTDRAIKWSLDHLAPGGIIFIDD